MQEKCAWSSTEVEVLEMLQDCLHYAGYTSGGLVPRPLRDTVHGTKANTVVGFE